MARKRGATREMPSLGWLPVTVPGAVDGWATLVERFGRKKLGETLEPAIDYAENGFPVSEIIAGSWRDMQSKCSMHPATAQAYLNRDQAAAHGRNSSSAGPCPIACAQLPREAAMHSIAANWQKKLSRTRRRPAAFYPRGFCQPHFYLGRSNLDAVSRRDAVRMPA